MSGPTISFGEYRELVRKHVADRRVAEWVLFAALNEGLATLNADRSVTLNTSHKKIAALAAKVNV